MNSVGSIKIVLSVNEQPAVSVTVTEKDPAYKLDTLSLKYEAGRLMGYEK